MTIYLIFIVTQIGLFAILGMALNLQWGFGGLLNFGVAGFYAAGAYGSVVLQTKLGVSAPLAMLAGALLGAALAWPLGLASIRLRVAFYLSIVTLGFAEVVRAVIINESWLTEGTRGLPVPRLFPDMGPLAYQTALLVLVVLLGLVVYWVFNRITNSPFGRTLEAIRDNEDAARSLGKPVAQYKIRVFMIGAAVMAAAGALNAHYVAYLVPELFLPVITFNIWMALVVGGTGSYSGVILGAFLIVSFFEGTRFLRDLMPTGASFTNAQLAAVRLMCIGAVLAVVPMVWPRGILGRRDL